MNYVKIVFSRFKGISYVPEEQYSAHSSDLLPTLDGVGGEKQYPPDVKSIEVSPVAAEICNYRFNKFGALVAREGQYLIYVNIPAIPTRPGFRSPKGCLFIQNYSLIDNVREVVFAEQNITNLLVRGEVWGNERDLPYCWGVVQFMRHNYYNQYYWNRYSYDFPYFRNFIASAIRISSQKQPVEEDGEIVFTLFPVDVIPVNHESAQPLILYGIENSNKVYNVPTGARDPGAFIFYKCFGQDEALRIYDGYAEPDRGYYYWYSIYGLPNADSSILTKSSVVSQVWSAPKRYTETPNINYNEISNPEYSYGAEDIWYKQYFHANQYHGQLIISDPINGDKILTDKYYEILPLQAEGASTVHHDFLMRDNCLIEFPTNIVEIDYCLGEDEENGKGVVTGMGLYRYYLPRNRVETAQVPFVPYWTQRAGQEFGDLHVFQKSFFDWRSVIMQYNPLLNDNERYNILQDS
ncbi:MAG: hypothetical protein KatS3mg083_124 [Candidatus Dojkabacteria bacterium]|nr:MAG: hypothetical protein KatS3mg083_124 [Candidatus Dojkabacteria bacterium]